MNTLSTVTIVILALALATSVLAHSWAASALLLIALIAQVALRIRDKETRR